VKIHLKTSAILIFITLCVGVVVGSKFGSKPYEELFAEFKTSQHSGDVRRFRFANVVLETLRNQQVSDAAYLLFVTADMNSSDFVEEEVSPALKQELAKFRVQYHEFMQSQCALSHSRACLSFGYLLEEAGEYDLAYESFLESAEGGELAAMAALADLHRNSNWPKHSEEVAKEWLYKVGKQ
jgi:hypothetical protein